MWKQTQYRVIFSPMLDAYIVQKRVKLFWKIVLWMDVHVGKDYVEMKRIASRFNKGCSYD